MAKYRKKPIVIEATQWWRNGDDSRLLQDLRERGFPPERGDVRYYRNPEVSDNTVCEYCSHIMHYHGWIDTPQPQGGHTVCPGDYIIFSIDNGEAYPCKPDVFERTCEKVDDS